MFVAAIGLGSFLSFVVQPLIARQLLPWFGGAPAVWTTCLVFFQMALVAGYGYAGVVTRLPARRQALLHVVVAAGAMLFLPILADVGSPATDSQHPTWRALVILVRTVGVPYVILAAGAPLLQDWARRRSGREPIRLYAISNAASLSALVAYPVVVEPLLPIARQAWAWSALFLIYVGLAALCARTLMRSAGATVVSAHASDDTAAHTPMIDRVLWFGASAIGSALLMAATNQLCQDIAAVPFLWVAPLAIYLASFIVSFAGLYRRLVWMPAFLVSLVATGYTLSHWMTLSVILQGGALLAMLASGCMICHGELVQLRPTAARLPGFYLTMAIGGAAGGLAVAVIAPHVFTTFVEFPLLVIAVVAVLGAAWGRELERRPQAPMPRLVWVAPLVIFSVVGSAAVARAVAPRDAVVARRNFFGVLRVMEDSQHTVRTLQHGHVVHGLQFLDPERRRIPTTYYGAGSGIARAIDLHRMRTADLPIAVAAVGLGAGTIASWGRRGDTFRFFEINPAVVDLAHRSFTFLQDSAATIDVVVGDGRLALEREREGQPSRDYDILVLDAFSGDAIPTHLLTREAMRTYRAALAPGGIMAFHVSNLFLDLRPVVAGLAADAGFACVEVHGAGDPASQRNASVWMLVAETHALLEGDSAPSAGTTIPSPVLWTDDYSSLWKVLK